MFIRFEQQSGYVSKIKVSMLLMIFLVICGGFAILSDYSGRPAAASDSVVRRWPNTVAEHESRNATVAIFYHPHCPCTRATIRCFERLAASIDSKPRIIAYAFCPPTETDVWINSDTTQKLQSLSDTMVIVDRSGEVCRKFGVMASGHVLAFDTNGDLIFSGGLTASRGHESYSKSGAAFVAALNGSPQTPISWPVFGCTIVEPTND